MLGDRYNQDSVFFKPAGQNPFLIGTSSKDEMCGREDEPWPGKGNIEPLGDFHPMKTGEFYTKMKGKTFVFST